MTSSVFMAIFSFAATNIDDIFVLMLLYAQVRNLKEIFPIIAGQYFGMGCLIFLSTLGALGANILSPDYVGFLGFLPLFLGIRAWFSYRHSKNETGKSQYTGAMGFFSVALLTIANGADNIGVYIPLFSGCSRWDFLIIIFIFTGMIGLWCYLGFVLINYPYIKDKILRYQHILVPVVLIILGLTILAKLPFPDF